MSDRYIRDGTRIISPQTVTMDTPGKAISSRVPLAKSSYREMRCVCVYVCARNACSRSRARGGVVGGRDGGTLVEKFPRAPQVFIGPSQQFACRQQRMCRQTPPLSLIEGPLRGTAQYADRVDALGVISVVVVLEYLTVIFPSLRKLMFINCNNIIHITLYS